MGNRAVIAFGKDENSTGIYLHWNGGPESVKAFLKAAKDLGARDPLEDNYGIARIAQIIGNFFGGTTSIGVGPLKELDTDNYDNGTYYVGPDFSIEERADKDEPMNEELYNKLIEINSPIFNRKD